MPMSEIQEVFPDTAQSTFKWNADGTMTASMKLRRRHLEAKFRDQIDAMYASENGAPASRASTIF